MDEFINFTVSIFNPRGCSTRDAWGRVPRDQQQAFVRRALERSSVPSRDLLMYIEYVESALRDGMCPTQEETEKILQYWMTHKTMLRGGYHPIIRHVPLGQLRQWLLDSLSENEPSYRDAAEIYVRRAREEGEFSAEDPGDRAIEARAWTRN